MECSRLLWLPMMAITVLLPRGNTASLIDLCHGYRYGVTTCWDRTQQFNVFDVQTGSGPNGAFITESFSTPEHCGTHLDAPFHFNPTGWKLEDIPLERLVVQGITAVWRHPGGDCGDRNNYRLLIDRVWHTFNFI